MSDEKPWYLTALDALLGLGQPAGTIGATISVPLGSGYDAAAAQAAGVARLQRLQAEAIALFPADPLPDGKWRTKCNFGAIHVADGLDCRDLDGLNATCIVRHLAVLCITRPQDWREDSIERGAAHAGRGGLTIYGIEAPPGELHGHVVTGAPGAMQWSTTWNALVPMVCNVGKPPNDIMRLSGAFVAEERPRLRVFLWRSQA